VEPANTDGWDFYVVATKFITQLPVPVLVSGAMSTKGQVMGILGFNTERTFIGFFNVDVLPLPYIDVGLEYRIGPNYGASGGNYVDGDYYNIDAG